MGGSTAQLAMRGRVLTPLGASDELLDVRDGAVLADADGNLTFVGSYAAARKRHRGPFRDVRPHTIVPGFVDAHVHYPQTRIIGQATGPLLEWLQESVFPEEARFARGAYARTVADEMVDRMLAMGTTTAAIFSSSSPRATEVLCETLSARGMRGLVGLTLMDARCPKALKLPRERALAASLELIRRWHGHDDRLAFAVTPRFAISCSRAMLHAAGRLAAEHDLPIQTHIGETREEGSQTLAVHRGRDYLDVYEQAGLIGPRTILAHAIYLSASEWKRVRDRGAMVAHCPDSNFFLGSGRMPLKKTLARGIPVGLGSDVAAGRSFSLRRAMAYAYDNALCLKNGGVPVATLFRLATLGGAQLCGWESRIGSLEVGKQADLVVLPLPAHAKTTADALAQLVFDSDDPRAHSVYVAGRRLI